MSEFLNLLSEVKKYMSWVKKDGLAIADVPLGCQSKRFQIAAVDQNVEAILLIPNPCEKACREALLCDVKIGDKLSNEIKEVYDLFELENDLKESIKVLDFNVDRDTQTVHIYGCENEGVSRIIIPKKINGYLVNKIVSWAFGECKNLRTITIPKTVVKIGERAFNNTPWLEEQRKKNPLVTINNILIDGETASGDITIPAGVVKIGLFAFAFCESLASITIPNSVKKIDSGAFRHCAKLSSVIIPGSVAVIDEYTFYGCINLVSITIPNGVTKINEYAFNSCNNLHEVIIPKTTTKIGKNAFFGCSKLKLKICGSRKDHSNWEVWGLKESQIEWDYVLET